MTKLHLRLDWKTSFSCPGISTLFAIAVLLLSSCSGEKGRSNRSNETDERLVVASNYPLAWMAETIGGDWITVLSPDDRATTPRKWRITDQELVAIQSAEIVLLHGAGYEDWINNISLPASRVVQTTAGFEPQWIEKDASLVHRHGPDGAIHEVKDFYVYMWLNPEFAEMQAVAIAEAFSKRWPQRSGEFEKGLSQLQIRLNEFAQKANEVRQTVGTRQILSDQPAYAYLSTCLECEFRPLPQDLKSAVENGMTDEVDTILDQVSLAVFLSPSSLNEPVESHLSSKDIQVVEFELCETRPTGNDDFVDIMCENLDRLARINLGD